MIPVIQLGVAMTSWVNRVGLTVSGASLALLVACAAGGAGPSPTEEPSSSHSEGGPMSPQVHVSTSTSSKVVSGISSGEVVVTINGRVCHLDVPDAVSVRTVTENSEAYIEITDKNGRTRRVDCSS